MQTTDIQPLPEDAPFPDREQIAQWAREAVENLPDMEQLMAEWIDTSTFLDENAVPADEEE